MVLTGAPLHIPDLTDTTPVPSSAFADWVRWGNRAYLGVPLRREGRTLGVLAVTRDTPGPFADHHISLLQTFADQAVIAIENIRPFSELQQENGRRQQELERARLIQHRLLPATIPTWPGKLEIAYRFQPAVETSCDFYDIVEATPTTPEQAAPLQIAVADVDGKGMGATLVMSLARAGLRAAAALPAALSPAATAHQVSNHLPRDVGSASFVACALATKEPPAGSRKHPRLRLVNAGQPPVLLCLNGTVTEVEPAGDRFP